MIKQVSIIASMLAALPAVGCTGIFTDRELPPLDARSDVHPDGADGETGGHECPDGLIPCTGECTPGEQYCDDGYSYVACQTDCTWGSSTYCGSDPEMCCNWDNGTCFAHAHPCL